MRGRRYGYLTPWRFFPESKQTARIKRPAFWLCLCRCGAFVEASTSALKTYSAISCERTLCRIGAEAALHKQWEDEVRDEFLNDALRKKITRNSYDAMLRRTRYNPKYVDRQVCPQWQGPDGYDQFVADLGLKRHGGLSIDRIDNSKGYSPENCRWATASEQNLNKGDSRILSVQGAPTNLTNFSQMIGQDVSQVSKKLTRLMANMTEDEAVEVLISTAHAPSTKHREAA